MEIIQKLKYRLAQNQHRNMICQVSASPHPPREGGRRAEVRRAFWLFPDTHRVRCDHGCVHVRVTVRMKRVKNV